MCPRGSVSVRRTPCHPGAAFSGAAFPVSWRLKARVTHRHAEVLTCSGIGAHRYTTCSTTRSTEPPNDGVGEAVGRMIRPGDRVFVCACVTGAMSAAIAPVCARRGLGAPTYRERARIQ